MLKRCPERPGREPARNSSLTLLRDYTRKLDLPLSLMELEHGNVSTPLPSAIVMRVYRVSPVVRVRPDRFILQYFHLVSRLPRLLFPESRTFSLDQAGTLGGKLAECFLTTL